MAKTVFREFWKFVAFDDTYQVEVEVPSIARGRLRMKRERAFQKDLVFEDLEKIQSLHTNTLLRFEHAP